MSHASQTKQYMAKQRI